MDRRKLVLLLGALVIAIVTALAARSMFADAAAPQAQAQAGPKPPQAKAEGPKVLVAQRSLPIGTILTADAVAGWSSEQFIGALRHEPANPAFNPHFRQLLHVGFKVAAQMGDRYLKLLEANEDVIARNVTGNLFDRHLKPLFV